VGFQLQMNGHEDQKTIARKEEVVPQVSGLSIRGGKDTAKGVYDQKKGYMVGEGH